MQSLFQPNLQPSYVPYLLDISLSLPKTMRVVRPFIELYEEGALLMIYEDVRTHGALIIIA